MQLDDRYFSAAARDSKAVQLVKLLHQSREEIAPRIG
jgi:hypothetical protein